MAQYTQRTQPMHRHSKWLQKTFGYSAANNPDCHNICELHADPEFVKIVKSRPDFKVLKSKFHDPSPGPSAKPEPEPESSPGSKKKPWKRPYQMAKRASKRSKKTDVKTVIVPDTNQVEANFEFLSLPEHQDEDFEIKVEPLEVAEEISKVETSPATDNDQFQTVEEMAPESDVQSEIIIKADPNADEAEFQSSFIPEYVQIKQEFSDLQNQTFEDSDPTTSQDNSEFDAISCSEIKYEDHSYFKEDINKEDMEREIKTTNDSEFDAISCSEIKYEDHSYFKEDINKEDMEREIKTEQNEIVEDPLEAESSFTVPLHYEVLESVLSDNATKTVPKDCNSVDELLKDLVERNYITTTEMNVLAAHKLESSLLKEEVPCTSTSHSKLQAFAVTLYVHSPQAYEYVRDNYTTTFPDETIVREWLVKPRGHSGFTSETLLEISKEAVRSKSPLLVCLDIKEIKLASSRAYQGPKQRGIINPLDWTAASASSAIVFTAVAIKANWKLMIGYFWTNVVKDKANLVKVAISILEKVGAEPVAISFEYNDDNLDMCRQLSNNIVCSIKHLACVFLSESGKEIFQFPDPRGVLEDMYKDAENLNSILDDNLSPVFLDHDKNILQNKLFGKQTASPQQLLRKIVASELFKSNFSECTEDYTASTIRFFKNLHVVLDFLSCRVDNRKFKISLNRVMNASPEPLRQAGKYFKSLQIKDSTMRKCIWGLCFLIDSALMFILKYPVQKFRFGRFVGSTYFLANLTPLGQNNRSPTALYFQTEYKATLQQIALGSQRRYKANVKNIPILKCNSPVDRINLTTYLSNGSTIMYVVDDLSILFGYKYTEYDDMVVVYIAKFVTYNLARRLRCEICIRALRSGVSITKSEVTRFAVKLDDPTPDVLRICKKAEAILKNAYCQTKSKLSLRLSLPVLVIKVMEEFIDRTMFEGIAHHQFDTDGTCNHIVELAKAVAELYLQTRIQHKTL